MDLFFVYTGMKVQDQLDDETYQAVDIMFKFRNALLHGNEIDIFFEKHKDTKVDDVEVLGKFKNILRYGDKKNLIVLEFDKEKIDLLTNEFIDHFFWHTTKYICSIYDRMPDRDMKRSSLDIFRVREKYHELKKIHGQDNDI